MKLEKIALWREQKLFAEQSDSRNGFMGYAYGTFGGNYLKTNTAMLNFSTEAQYEYETLLCFLRSAEGCYLFQGEPAMTAYCREKIDCHIPYPFRRECWGFRVMTDAYVWYIAATPWNEKKQFTIYAYKRELLMSVLAKEQGLPENCYGVSPYTGERIRIRFGDTGYESFPQYGGNAKANGAFAEEMNKSFGVNKAQRAAMENGAIYGWDTPAANPSYYDKDGYYLPPEEGGKR